MKYVKLRGCDTWINLETINSFSYVESCGLLYIHNNSGSNIVIEHLAEENYLLLQNAVIDYSADAQ